MTLLEFLLNLISPKRGGGGGSKGDDNIKKLKIKNRKYKIINIKKQNIN